MVSEKHWGSEEYRKYREQHVEIVRARLDPDGDGLDVDLYRAMDDYLRGRISLSAFADEVGALFLIVSLPRPGWQP